MSTMLDIRRSSRQQHQYAEWGTRGKKLEPQDGFIANLGQYTPPAKSPKFVRDFDKADLYFPGRPSVGGRRVVFFR